MTALLVRRRSDVVAIAAGMVVLAVGMVVVRDGQVPEWEQDVFFALNDLPDELEPVLWPFQQFGALLAGVAAAFVAVALRRNRLALAALAVTAGKLVLERLVKAVVSRERPVTSIGTEVHTRGDVSIRGESFVSGHALLAAALAAIITPLLTPRWQAVAWTIVAVVMAARVYVGAHNPLDVVCGAGLGLALGASVNLALGLPRRSHG